MPITVPIDDIVFAWNNYLECIHRQYYLEHGTADCQRTGHWPNWRRYFKACAKRDYDITVLDNKGRPLGLHQNTSIGSFVFADEGMLTQFLLKYSDIKEPYESF